MLRTPEVDFKPLHDFLFFATIVGAVLHSGERKNAQSVVLTTQLLLKLKVCKIEKNAFIISTHTEEKTDRHGHSAVDDQHPTQ